MVEWRLIPSISGLGNGRIGVGLPNAGEIRPWESGRGDSECESVRLTRGSASEVCPIKSGRVRPWTRGVRREVRPMECGRSPSDLLRVIRGRSNGSGETRGAREDREGWRLCRLSHLLIHEKSAGGNRPRFSFLLCVAFVWRQQCSKAATLVKRSVLLLFYWHECVWR